MGLHKAVKTVMDKLAVHNDSKAMKKAFGH